MNQAMLHTICGHTEQNPSVSAFEISSYSPFMTISRGDRFQIPSQSTSPHLPADMICEVLAVEHHILESEHPEIDGRMELEHAIHLTLKPL